ncbi:hypothetical protein LCGC14_1070460 [marine sediment metagenome]|uniref:Uncharacterized protein n=1 Tax=marine sediment metagenome TaxID=412755 RepID=A0A0F9MNA2_9ZZZZ
MRTHDGYIPRAIKDLCNEINRVRGVVTHSDQLGAQQKAMLEGQLDVIADKVSACTSGVASCEVHTSDAKVYELVRERVDCMIKKYTWIDPEAMPAQHFKGFREDIADFLVPLLRQAGWFVDEDDGMLTCVCNHHKENEVLLLKRPPDVINEEMQLNLANAQLVARFNSEKMEVAIKTLRLLETSDRLTLKAVSEIALKALDDIAAIGNPGLEG